MSDSTASLAEDCKLIECCASRIVGLTVEIERAWEIGIPHGDHREPWTLDFQRVAVAVYLETIPAEYALKVSAAFEHCAERMRGVTHPMVDRVEWRLVHSYLQAVSDSIGERLGTSAHKPPAEPVSLKSSTPGIVRFDKIAPLVHSTGVARLKLAAELVQCQDLTGVPYSPTSDQVALLGRLADGQRIVDIACSIGCSERTLYRRLRSLRDHLGLDSTKAAILYAGQRSWL